MSVQFRCPSCGTQLTLSDLAPQQVTCPRCLAKIERPMEMLSTAGVQRVIPVEQQAYRDVRMTQIVLGIAAIIIVLGGIVLVRSNVMGAVGPFVLLIILVVAGAAGFAFTSTRGEPHAPPRIPGPASPQQSQQPPPLLGQAGRPVIEYHSRDMVAREGIRVLAFVLAFFGALGVCAGGFILLLVTLTQEPPVRLLCLSAVAVALIASVIGSIKINNRGHWRGFLPGAIVGLGLGMLALGPCGFCYVITIGEKIS